MPRPSSPSLAVPRWRSHWSRVRATSTPRRQVRASAAPTIALSPPIASRCWPGCSCVECSGGELDSVVALGNSPDSGLGDDRFPSVGPLGRASAARQVEYPHAVRLGIHRGLARRGRGGDRAGLSRTQYVKPLLDDFFNTYRLRAARALAKIGGPVTRAALDSALTSGRLTTGESLPPGTPGAHSDDEERASRPELRPHNFVNTYRIRAARGLAKIGGPIARAAPDRSLTRRPRSRHRRLGQ